MTSETSAGSTLARFSASMMATLPSSWAARLARAPLNEPTGVRAAEVMTTSVMGNSLDGMFVSCNAALTVGFKRYEFKAEYAVRARRVVPCFIAPQHGEPLQAYLA